MTTCSAVADTACLDNGDDFTADLCTEPGNIAATNGLASRHGETLSLATAAGEITFNNADQCGSDGRPFNYDNCHSYIFLHHWTSSHGYVIRKAYYEGQDYLWVDDIMGRMTYLGGKPRLSPSGKLFAVIIADEAHNDFQVGVWSTDGPKQLWQFRPQDYAFFSFVSWNGEDEIQLTVIMNAVGTRVAVPARIVRDGACWRREGPPAR